MAIGNSSNVDPGPKPANYSDYTFDFLPPGWTNFSIISGHLHQYVLHTVSYFRGRIVLFDSGDFGSIYLDVQPTYHVGETVQVIFYGANPRNDVRNQGSGWRWHVRGGGDAFGCDMRFYFFYKKKKKQDTFLTVEYLNPKTQKWEVSVTSKKANFSSEKNQIFFSFSY